MQAPILLPDLGTEPLVLSVWFADVGDLVYEGDRLVEVHTPGATFDIAAPATGQLQAKHAWPNDRLHPGQVLGVVEVAKEE